MTSDPPAELPSGRESSLFQLLFENSGAGVVVVRAPGTIVRANATFCRLLGYEPGELDGRRVLDVTYPDDLPASREALGEDTSSAPDIHLEKRYLRKDGSPVWAEVMARWFLDAQGEPLWSVALVFDIHRRKEAESRLQALASELTIAEERERRRLAEELHDQVGQGLAVANLHLGRLRRVGLQSSGDEALDQVQRLLEEAIRFTRAVTFELSPPLLHQLGLPATLEWLAEQQSTLLGVPVCFRDDGRAKPLRDEVQILLFRSVRELLINVAKHARASRVQVVMRREGRLVVIEVDDDGVGVESLDLVEQPGFGLYSIRERMIALGGELRIHGEYSGGTRIVLQAPLDAEGEANR